MKEPICFSDSTTFFGFESTPSRFRLQTIWSLGMIVFLLISTNAISQRSISVSVFNNATKLPVSSFSAVWNQPLHPGICAGYEFQFQDSSHWFHSINAGFYYHQFAQAGIQLFYNLRHRREISPHFTWDASFLAGYLHAIPLTEQAKLNSDGEYEIKNGLGRPQAMFGFQAGISYLVKGLKSKPSLFLQYHVWLQFPFVPGYVPLLPNGSVHFGMRFPFNPDPK